MLYEATANSTHGIDAMLVYQIEDGNSSLFAMNSSSGALSLVELVDLVDGDWLCFTLIVTDLSFQVIVAARQLTCIQV